MSVSSLPETRLHHARTSTKRCPVSSVLEFGYVGLPVLIYSTIPGERAMGLYDRRPVREKTELSPRESSTAREICAKLF